MSHDMTMRVSTDLYLYHTSRPQLMRFFRPPPVKDCNFSFYFAFLTHSCLFHSPHLTWTTGPLSTKQFIFLARIWHINASGLVLTSHVVKSIHINTHTCSPDLCPRARSVCVPLPQSISCVYWYVWEPSTSSILHGWSLDHCPPSWHGALPVPLQSIDHTRVLFKLFLDS